MINKLTLTYNKARQTADNKELIAIKKRYLIKLRGQQNKK
jgi:hypothetical protein